MLKISQRNHRIGIHLTRAHPNVLSSFHFSTKVNNKAEIQEVLDFSDAKTIYASKSNKQLLRGILVLRISGIRPLVTNALPLLKFGEKNFGKAFVKKILEWTFFGHFCAGEDQESIRPTVKALMDAGVGSILDYAAEV
jgi:hypothetical protein